MLAWSACSPKPRPARASVAILSSKPPAVSSADARSFLTYLKKVGYSAGSGKKQIAFLKAMFDFGFHEFERGGVNPWGKLKVVVPEGDDDNGVSLD